MAKYEIRISKEDLEEDESPEILFEFYEYKDADSSPDEASLEYVAFVSSSNKDGHFDTVSGNTDIDGQTGHDSRDAEILFELARAFSKIHFEPRS
ncbi:hypothetical protein K5D34_10905 [Pseudomonas cichorii]|nr:hypothetical protein [Pseudomonas cichorii]MBX8510187.1 hypothetical protein [Pseudomonas cichorii]MBX8525268.1 hypothetical protein [Pseudomonas cichorii]MBX8553976.1 hypothetical protein [Pseudomonas cichorii]MBX8560502.1 hypothetical protein [Pseudomonas cichorii]MBX8570580.1 hypothetical protein [Pseudomonas cichorii]